VGVSFCAGEGIGQRERGEVLGEPEVVGQLMLSPFSDSSELLPLLLVVTCMWLLSLGGKPCWDHVMHVSQRAHLLF
jgi:hypothetical protein